MFRNVRSEPRRFQFRSRHLPDLDTKWAERKERIEAEGDLEDPVGQMRGYNGLDDRFAVVQVSLTFRIDKSPNTCWD